jgi:hypothetical protein
MTSDFWHYLASPQVTEALPRSNARRNVWVSVEGREPWSATGVSAAALAGRWESKEES